ncbi:hypothetical protein GCM10017783_06940 [Deinococcus piscis]|uniref:Uncharacterized protein n=1 Tax=Deinococcus piscis TaxID=394230 RepID=A0ABQ3K4M7_9DEIO|nr:hypothetical protein [Deinococcus piscis]GHF97664.1 hypothetical protein GCM10017783_06940 [Deinococcus piscis]
MAGAFVALLLVLGLLTAGLTLWRLDGTGPNYKPLDFVAWRLVSPVSAPLTHPRRDMAYAAQDWLEAKHPDRSEVYSLLGPADAFPAASAEAYRVGCGFTAHGCQTEDWLVVEYGADGRVVSTAFQPAGYLPAAAPD